MGSQLVEQVRRSIGVLQLQGLTAEVAGIKVKNHVESLYTGSEVVLDESWFNQMAGMDVVTGVVHHPDHQEPIRFSVHIPSSIGDSWL